MLKPPSAEPAETERDYTDFWSEFELAAADLPELGRLKAGIERAIAAQATRTRIGDDQSQYVLLRALRGAQRSAHGGIAFRIFWWGFHIEIPSPDLDLFAHDTTGIVDALKAITASAPALHPHLLATVGFLTTHVALLRRLDTGKGVYVAMLWSAAGLFAPTRVK